MREKLKQIFEEMLLPGGHYLLGLSGGVDSMALFYGLVEHGISFEVCTIDHQSRSNIPKEIAFLKNLCFTHSVPFHVRKVEGVVFGSSNLEETYRKKRYALFQEVFSSGNFEALLLGHHADDQVETLLKRLFEGSYFHGLGAMRSTKVIKSMKIIRPFLSIEKQDLVSWMISKEHQWFEDETNLHQEYLRARMRQKIIPVLKEEFGKEFTKNILVFGQRMHRLVDHFDEMPLKKIEGPFGVFYPVETKMSSFAAEHYFRRVCHQEGICVSREEGERMALALTCKQPGIQVKRKHACILSEHHGLLVPYEGEVQWDVKEKKSTKSGWQAVLEGEVSISSIESGFVLKLPNQLTLQFKQKTSLKKWYALHKVPVFLRSRIPVLFNGETIREEYLTGKSDGVGEGNWVLTFKRKASTIASVL